MHFSKIYLVFCWSFLLLFILVLAGGVGTHCWTGPRLALFQWCSLNTAVSSNNSQFSCYNTTPAQLSVPTYQPIATSANLLQRLFKELIILFVCIIYGQNFGLVRIIILQVESNFCLDRVYDISPKFCLQTLFWDFSRVQTKFQTDLIFSSFVFKLFLPEPILFCILYEAVAGSPDTGMFAILWKPQSWFLFNSFYSSLLIQHC